MSKLKLSVAALEWLRHIPAEQRAEFSIDVTEGLILRVPVKPAGRCVWRASFWLRFRYDGMRHKHKLNQFAVDADREVLAAAVHTAKTKARKMLAELAAGRNPLAASREPTFGQYVEQFYGPWITPRSH